MNRQVLDQLPHQNYGSSRTWDQRQTGSFQIREYGRLYSKVSTEYAWAEGHHKPGDGVGDKFLREKYLLSQAFSQGVS